MTSKNGQSALAVPVNKPRGSISGTNTPVKFEADGLLNASVLCDTGSSIQCCKFTDEINNVAVGTRNGQIKIFSIENAHLLHVVSDKESEELNLPVTSIVFTPPKSKEEKSSKTILASYASGHIRLWHYPENRLLHKIDEQRQIIVVAYNCNITYFAAGGDDDYITVYNTRDMNIKSKLLVSGGLSGEKTKMRIFALQFHPSDPNLMISSGWDNCIQIWDVNQEIAIRKIFGVLICGDGLDIDPVSNVILAVSAKTEDAITLYNFDTGQKVESIIPDSYPCSNFCGQFIGKHFIATGGSDQNMFRLISRTTSKTLGRCYNFSGGIMCMDNNRKGQYPKIMFCSQKSIILVDVIKGSHY